jgi:hypothetical protein
MRRSKRRLHITLVTMSSRARSRSWAPPRGRKAEPQAETATSTRSKNESELYVDSLEKKAQAALAMAERLQFAECSGDFPNRAQSLGDLHKKQWDEWRYVSLQLQKGRRALKKTGLRATRGNLFMMTESGWQVGPRARNTL